MDLFPDRPAAEAGVNREPRVTGTFLIDITASLSSVIAAYMAALTALYSACRQHPATRSSAFVSTTLCGGGRHTPAPFVPFAAAELPAFELVGGSPGGHWLKAGVEHLRAEHARMTADGVPSNKDVLLLVSDFHWDDPEAFDEAIDVVVGRHHLKRDFEGPQGARHEIMPLGGGKAETHPLRNALELE